MVSLIEFLSVMVMSGFKYLLGNMMAIAFNLNFLSGMIVTVAGGIAGVIVYILFGKAIQRFYYWLLPSRKTKTIAFWKRRWIIKAKKMGGLMAIAILTPPLFMVPGGTFIAMAMGFRWTKILLTMFISFSLWSATVLGLFNILDLNTDSLTAKIFGN